MSIQGANLPFSQTGGYGRYSRNSWDAMQALGNGQSSPAPVEAASPNKNTFANFITDQLSDVQSTLKNTESSVQAFTEGKLDIESVTPKVAAAGLEVEALTRIVEVSKTAVNGILNMQI